MDYQLLIEKSYDLGGASGTLSDIADLVLNWCAYNEVVGTEAIEVAVAATGYFCKGVIESSTER